MRKERDSTGEEGDLRGIATIGPILFTITLTMTPIAAAGHVCAPDPAPPECAPDVDPDEVVGPVVETVEDHVAEAQAFVGDAQSRVTTFARNVAALAQFHANRAIERATAEAAAAPATVAQMLPSDATEVSDSVESRARLACSRAFAPLSPLVGADEEVDGAVLVLTLVSPEAGGRADGAWSEVREPHALCTRDAVPLVVALLP